METQPIASIKPAENSDDNSTGIIVLGILIPLAIILLLFLIYHFRKQRNEKTQSTPYKTMRDGTQVLDAEGQVAQGVTKEDLKFIVPYYSAYHSEIEGRRSESPIYPLPSSRHIRHQSAPAGPFLSYAKDLGLPDLPGKTRGDLSSRASTPERPATPLSGASRRVSGEMHGICVQMYTSESDGDSTAVTDSEERATSKGKLCFGVELIVQQNALKIHLKHALSLRSKSMKGSIHPAIRVSMHPDPRKNKFFTRACNSANPQLNETFTFALPQPEQSPDEHVDGACGAEPFHDITHLRELEIGLALFHCDVFSRKTEVGHIKFKPFEMTTSSLPITHPMFQPGGIEVWRDFKCFDDRDDSERESRGQILVSLSRDPDKKSLSISIVKGKDIDIQHAGSESSSMLFAKMALVHGGKVLKSKKTKSTKKTQNPTFGETFRFSSVKTSWLNKISLVVTICAKNVLGSSRPIGRVTLGPVMYAFGSGLEHWNDMISEPKSGVSQWHHIY